MFVEYAKESPEDILVQISIHNRGPEAGGDSCAADALVPQPLVVGHATTRGRRFRPSAAIAVVTANEADLGERYLYCDGQASLLFTENETNAKRLFGGQNRTPFVKDGINNFVVHGQTDAVNPQKTGHQGGGALPPDRAAGQVRDGPAAADRRGAGSIGPVLRQGRRRVRQTFRRGHAGAPAGGG